MQKLHESDRWIVIPQTFSLGDTPLLLENGQSLFQIHVRYETYGTLNAQKSNAIYLCHAFSGDAHAAGYHTEGDQYAGWWDNMVGAGKTFDTNKYFMICSNVLGGCMGTTGPGSVNPETNEPYAMEFPSITLGDMVNLQKLLIEHLGISRLIAVAGGSMGGMLALEWSVRFPEMVQSCIVLASTPRLTAQGIAFNAVGRNAIVSDPGWMNGRYYGHTKPSGGLAIARMVGHITYLSDESMRSKFGRRMKDTSMNTNLQQDLFEVEGYLLHQGSKFVERFDANTYIYLTRAMDWFDLGNDHGGLKEAFRRAKKVRYLIISFTSDWLFPTYQSKEMVFAMLREGCEASFTEIKSPYGHDAFLLEVSQQDKIIRSFLGGLNV